jgi:hypothetical protein
MPDSFRFPYVPVTTAFSSSFMRPLMPLTLERSGRIIQSNALIDTGADVNVMPYTLGLALGGDWLNQLVTPSLGGAFKEVETRALLASIRLGELEPIPLAFVWAQSDNVPLILGQLNFFDAFNVCFFRGEGYFEVTPRR